MNSIRLAGIDILIMAFIVGCAGDYGKIRKQSPADNKMTLSELSENWQDYHIYYGTRGGRPRPQGIIFDPKNNDTRLIGDSWIKIADQTNLSEAISIIQNDYDNAKVEIIEGSDGRFFGYMYYPHWLYIYVEIVDDQTLYVSSMPGFGSAP